MTQMERKLNGERNEFMIVMQTKEEKKKEKKKKVSRHLMQGTKVKTDKWDYRQDEDEDLIKT